MLRSRLAHLKQILGTKSTNFPAHVIEDLNKNTSIATFGNFQEYANSISKLLDSCISLLEVFSQYEVSHKKQKDDTTNVDEIVQTELSLKEKGTGVEDIESEDLTSTLSLMQVSHWHF